MIFKTTEEDDKKIKDWYDNLKPMIMKMVKERFKDDYNTLTNNGKVPYYGAIELGRSSDQDKS